MRPLRNAASILRRPCMVVELLSLGLAAWPGVAAGLQASGAVATPPRCPTCAIGLVPVVVLGDPADSVAITANSQLARDARGRYYVAPVRPGGRIAVFEGSGRWLRSVGAPGGGPGEFRGPDLVMIGAGDTVLVFDGPRLTVLSPDYALVRTVRLPGRVYAAAPVGSGAWVLNVLGRPVSGGIPLLQVMVGDSLVRAFAVVQQFDSRRVLPFLRLAAGSRGVWAIPAKAYHLEQWDAREGVLLRSLDRKPDWFPWPASGAPDPRGPVVMAVREDRRGLVWVAVRVARGGGGERGRGPIPEAPLPPAGEVLAGFQSRIEVIEPGSRSLVVSTVVERLLSGFLDADLAYGFGEGPEGLLRLEVFRLDWRGPKWRLK